MSKWDTPPEFETDGCTWPSILNDLMGAHRYQRVCKRHDFECLYGLYGPASSRDYLIRGMRLLSPWYLLWRLPIVWMVLTVIRGPCSNWSNPVPDKWSGYVSRDYGLPMVIDK